jgi:hypothetical protein
MRKTAKMAFSVTILCLLAVLGCSLQIAASKNKIERVARVSMLRGTVKDTTSGSTLRLFDSILGGHTLEVAKGASMRLIFYRDYHEEELKGKCSASVDEKGMTLLNGDPDKKKTTREVFKSNLSENYIARGKEIAAGGSRPAIIRPADYPLYAIADTLDLPERLNFSWKQPRGKKTPYYRVTIGRFEGEEPVPLHSSIVTEQSFIFPDSLKPLEAGKVYFFSVEGFLKHPGELGAEFDVSRIAASAPPYIFAMPSQDVVRIIGAQELLLKKLKPGSEEWTSNSLFLFSLYMEYGADDRAARMARELRSYGKESDLFQDNPHLEGLMECFAK